MRHCAASVCFIGALWLSGPSGLWTGHAGEKNRSNPGLFKTRRASGSLDDYAIMAIPRLAKETSEETQGETAGLFVIPAN
jgi:hypothetical protein